jgi:hypothetical protein
MKYKNGSTKRKNYKFAFYEELESWMFSLGGWMLKLNIPVWMLPHENYNAILKKIDLLPCHKIPESGLKESGAATLHGQAVELKDVSTRRFFAGLRIRDCFILDRILDTGSRILDHVTRIPDPGSWIPDPGSRISDLGSRIPDPGSNESATMIFLSWSLYLFRYNP